MTDAARKPNAEEVGLVATAKVPAMKRLLSWVRHSGETVHLGLAIAPDRIVAVELTKRLTGMRPGRVHARSLAPPEDDGTRPDLTEAIADLLNAIGARRGTASIALLRPLAQAKVISAPPLTRRDLRLLVTRNARRYFITGTDPVVADALRSGVRRREKPTPAVATCADAGQIEAIHRSVTQGGLHNDFITAAPLALAEAIRLHVPDARRGPVVVAVCSRGWCEGITLSDGTPYRFEPWTETGAAEPPDLAARIAQTAFGEAGGTEPTVRAIVVAPSAERKPIVDEVRRELGDDLIDLPASVQELEPAAMAAYGAVLMREDAPALLPQPVRRDRQRRIRRRVGALAAAAVVMLSVSAGLHLWDLRRELEAVAASRQVLAPRVSEILELRRSLHTVNTIVDGVAKFEESAVHWTPVMAALAEALPESAYLVSMTADGIELRLAGVAEVASLIVPALEASPLLREVSLTVARRSGGAQGGEQFDVGLALERRRGGGN
jgi:hypothetical protein